MAADGQPTNPTGRVAAVSLALLLLCLTFVRTAAAQQENPVYVDDSPRAWELFQRAEDQRGANTGEAARLYQEILDEYALRLLPIAASQSNQFTAARLRVLAALRRDDDLLERYRLIEAAEADRMLDRSELEALAITRPLTGAGLQALLRLSQAAIEDGRFDVARTWMDTIAIHPDLSDVAQRVRLQYWYMRGVTALFTDDEDAYATIRDSLARFDGNEAELMRQSLADLREADPTPLHRELMTGFDQFGNTAVEEFVGDPIWSVSLPHSPYRRQFESEESVESDPDPDRITARLLTVSPAMNERTVYINEGHTVRALDRYSHRERWSYTERSQMSIVDNQRETAGDMNMFVVRGDRLVTLTGHAHTHHRSSSGAVLCLDAETGSYHWQVELSDLGSGDELEGLFPHGRPVIAGDHVYVAARKVSRQNVTSAYVVALDLSDGRLVWARHIASSGGVRTNLARPVSSLAHHKGNLYVGSAVGAMARLDAATGQVRWLRRYAVPINPGNTNRMPWEVTMPVITQDGIVMLEHGQPSRVVVLDRNLGDPIESQRIGRGTPWGAARYLIGDQEMIFAVGQDIRAFHLDDLESPLWVFPGDDGDPSTPMSNLFGRAQLGENVVAVPTNEGLFLVDRYTGEPRVHLPDAIGNPLVYDDQLLVAGPTRLNAYMPLHVAEDMIRGRIDAEPDDPDPALTLLDLGLRADRLSLVIEGAETAAARLNDLVEPHPRDVDRLFSQLLEVTPEMLAQADDPLEAGERIHMLLSDLAVDPARQVEQHLARGQWTEAYDAETAMNVYQTVLDRPELHEHLRKVDDVSRPAGMWAAERQASLISANDASLYDDLADRALSMLRELPADADSSDLLRMAQRYPLSPAAVDACMQAMDKVGDSTEPHALLAVVQQCYLALATSQPEGAAAVVQHYIQEIERSAPEQELDALQSWAARRFADQADHSFTRGQHDDQANRDLDKLAELPDVLTADRRWRGVMLQPRYAAAPDRGSGLVLIHDRDMIRAVEVSGEQTAWRAEVEQPVEVLRNDERGIFLWMSGHGLNPRILMLDAATGAEQWTTGRISRIFDDSDRLTEPPQGTQIHLADGKPFDPREALPLLLDDRALIVRRTGSIACFDLDDGALLWSRDKVLRQVHLAKARSWGIVLAGSEQPAIEDRSRSRSGWIAALDPNTGRTISSVKPLDDWPVHWLEIGPLGTAATRNEAGIEVVDLLTGRPVWRNESEPARQATDSWLIDRHVLIANEDAAMRFLNAERGTTGGPLAAQLDEDWNQSELVSVKAIEGDALVQLQGEVLRFHPDGTLTGQLMATDERQFRLPLVRDNGLLYALNQVRSRQERIGEGGERRMVHQYILYITGEDGRVLREVELHSVEDQIRNLAVHHGRLLFSTQATTFLVDGVDPPTSADP